MKDYLPRHYFWSLFFFLLGFVVFLLRSLVVRPEAGVCISQKRAPNFSPIFLGYSVTAHSTNRPYWKRAVLPPHRRTLSRMSSFTDFFFKRPHIAHLVMVQKFQQVNLK